MISIRRLVIACVLILGMLIAGLGAGPAYGTSNTAAHYRACSGECLLSVTGKNSLWTKTFRAPATWDLDWSFNCAGATKGVTFRTGVYRGTVGMGPAVHSRQRAASGDERLTTGSGVYRFKVASKCKWSLEARQIDLPASPPSAPQPPATPSDPDLLTLRVQSSPPPGRYQVVDKGIIDAQQFSVTHESGGDTTGQPGGIFTTSGYAARLASAGSVYYIYVHVDEKIVGQGQSWRSGKAGDYFLLASNGHPYEADTQFGALAGDSSHAPTLTERPIYPGEENAGWIRFSVYAKPDTFTLFWRYWTDSRNGACLCKAMTSLYVSA